MLFGLTWHASYKMEQGVKVAVETLLGVRTRVRTSHSQQQQRQNVICTYGKIIAQDRHSSYSLTKTKLFRALNSAYVLRSENLAILMHNLFTATSYLYLSSLSFPCLFARITSTGFFSATACMRLLLHSRYFALRRELRQQEDWHSHSFPRIRVRRG